MFYSLYKLGSFVLFLLGVMIFALGVYMLNYNTSLFMDWEFMSMNGSVMVMTLFFDFMSLMFISCVFFISSMVIYYSESYMMNDINKTRFYFMIILFVMSMMFMIISPNLISILIGWDGLGLVSYCLVIYFQNYKSYAAGMLTILTNRLGDVALLISIAWFFNYGSWHFIKYLNMWENWSFYLVLMIVLAGFTKSAQIPFSSWLPAAMAAPTPVSSLVHSSTLVTAGVYLLIRFSELFNNMSVYIILLISVLTMFMSGLGASFEYDLKKIIALSTLSQLGLMMSILFMGFPILSFFHLLTHAFFKALLFLCAGLIIHCLSDSQDIRHMGSVSLQLPFTCTCFCISNLSLCGTPFLSGFYSKDMIMEIMFMYNYNFYIYMLFMISLGLTVMYTFRLIYYCFSYNLNLYVCQSYYEDYLMMKSMVFLTIMAVLGGSLLGWLIFGFPYMICLPFFLKISILLMVFFGAWLGYELCYFSNLLLFTLRFYFSSNFFGSMWFMPYFSTFMIYSNSLYLSKNYLEVMDGGWGEYMISMSHGIYISMLSRVYNYYHYNNLKIFILTFLFLVFFMII
uniref:NADH-ubiquinone oxidoreductase chain 5 n=1 Tax=Ectrychotes andreae TaxID=204515 RepID=A0A7I6HJP7_9HEMI|nr:NADH dehydrogenase subunit 5 [Ectrychotes andreae]